MSQPQSIIDGTEATDNSVMAPGKVVLQFHPLQRPRLKGCRFRVDLGNFETLSRNENAY